MSNNNLLTYKVTTKDTLNRADIFIKEKFENFTRSQIKKLIESTGIRKSKKTCGGCKARQEKLNKLFPYKKNKNG